MRLIKASTAPATTFDSAAGAADGTWVTEEVKCADKSKIAVGFFIDKGDAATLTVAVLARVLNDPIQDPPDRHQDVAYDKWHQVYAVSGGTGALDEVAITLTADAYIILPLSVENYASIKIMVKVDDATGCKVTAYELGKYIQKVQQGNIQNG